jgi:hypothetical protein
MNFTANIRLYISNNKTPGLKNDDSDHANIRLYISNNKTPV